MAISRGEALDHGPKSRDGRPCGRAWPERGEPPRAALTRLCATYLTRPASPGNRIDPVGRFHLGNGARMERTNWLSNTAPRAIRESFGIMVNYLYVRDSIEENDEAVVRDETIVRSADVDALMPGPA
jgi:malonyl-CoA decarboxylase